MPLPERVANPEVAKAALEESAFCALYPSLIGPDWDLLDARLKRFHSYNGARSGKGTFQIRHGASRRARFLAWLLRLPRAGSEVPVQLQVRSGIIEGKGQLTGEIWRRQFGERELISVQYANHRGFLAERFGWLELWFRLHAANGALEFKPAGGAIALGSMRIKIPFRLCPRVDARVVATPERTEAFSVSVNLQAPLVGMILHYEGYVAEELTTP